MSNRLKIHVMGENEVKPITPADDELVAKLDAHMRQLTFTKQQVFNMSCNPQMALMIGAYHGYRLAKEEAASKCDCSDKMGGSETKQQGETV